MTVQQFVPVGSCFVGRPRLTNCRAKKSIRHPLGGLPPVAILMLTRNATPSY
jgi:hypothetical protein